MRNKGKKKRLSATDIIETRHKMSKGITTYNPKSLIRTIMGISVITTGLITFFVPCTTLPLLLYGCILLGFDYKKHKKKILYEIHLFKLRLGIPRCSAW